MAHLLRKAFLNIQTPQAFRHMYNEKRSFYMHTIRLYNAIHFLKTIQSNEFPVSRENMMGVESIDGEFRQLHIFHNHFPMLYKLN